MGKAESDVESEVENAIEEMLVHLESGPGAGPALLERVRANVERWVARGDITAEQGQTQIEYIDRAIAQMREELK